MFAAVKVDSNLKTCKQTTCENLKLSIVNFQLSIVCVLPHPVPGRDGGGEKDFVDIEKKKQ